MLTLSVFRSRFFNYGVGRGDHIFSWGSPAEFGIKPIDFQASICRLFAKPVLIKTYPLLSSSAQTNNGSNGNGLSATSTDKDSLTPSPPVRLSDNVKAEPMELVCNNHNLVSDDHSNDSIGDHEAKYLGSGLDGKGSLR